MLSAISGEEGLGIGEDAHPFQLKTPGIYMVCLDPTATPHGGSTGKSTTNMLVEFLEYAAVALLKITTGLQDLTFAKVIQFKRLKVLVCSIQ